MKKLKHLLAHTLMSAMYDIEPELHPQDAYGLAIKLIENNSSVRNLIIYINKYFFFKFFVTGILIGLILGLIFIYIWF